MSNLSIRFRIISSFYIIFSLSNSDKATAQDSALKVISEWEDHAAQVRQDSNQRMVELRSFIPGLPYDLRYATEDNFMKRKMYPPETGETYLRLPAARALQKVEEELNSQGLGLKIFDAYRPYAVTVKFWELVRDERYVANPSKGSGHNRGIAVDLTIIDLALGIELNMGTDFDNFSDTAHQDYQDLPAEILKHRKLLRDVMTKHGFRIYPDEWWHYSYPGNFDVLDLSFKELKKKLAR